MQVEAIYDQGKLEWITPVKLKPGRIHLVVQIPDEQIVTPSKRQPAYELPPEVLAQALAMEEKLERVRNAPLPADEDLPPLSEKKLARIEAFAQRDEIRDLR
jgi:hypothetical protein